MVASRYYLDYRSMKLFRDFFGGPGGENATLEHLCRLLADAQVPPEPHFSDNAFHGDL